MSAEERSFVDTNVLLYAYDPSAGTKHVSARELVQNLWKTRSGALSVQVLQEFFVNATQKIERPLDVATASKRVRGLGRWTTHTPDASDVLEAIEIHRRSKIAFWDAMIVRSASQLGCTTLWTEDLNDGQIYGGVRVTNPFTT